jgi:hypothetical protein
LEESLPAAGVDSLQAGADLPIIAAKEVRNIPGEGTMHALQFRRPWRAAIVALAAISLYGCSTFVGHLADSVYPALAETFDTEAPPTPGAVPPSADIVALIGGKGEGLSCSIPAIAQSALFSRDSKAAPVSMQFRQACAYHDYCYRHGEATYGYSQNDCDFALQRFSYRLCRQIEAASTHAECEQRARQVLLGVRMFGGKAFQAGGASSYFEFDPMPARADNYMVGRIVAPQSAADRAELVTLLFEQYTLRSRVVDWVKQDPLAAGNAKTPFPMGAIPTPPSVVRTSNGDKLLALSRQTSTNTAATAIEFVRRSSAQPEYFAAAAAFRIDHDASEHLIRATSDGRLSALALSHRPVRLYKGLVDLSRADETEIMHVDWTDGQDAPGTHDYYRLLQHPPLLTEDEHGEAALVLRRGADATGTAYQEKGPMLLFRLDGAARQASAVADDEARIEEADEPLVAVPVARRRSLFFSVHAARHRVFGKDEAPSLHVFEIAGSRVLRQSPIALDAVGIPDNTWLRQPVQFVRGGEGRTYVFFSRACPDNPACNWTLPATRDDVLYEFRYFSLVTTQAGKEERFGTTRLAPAGNAMVRIDIASQFKILAQAHPQAVHGIRADAFEGGQARQQWEGAVRADLVRRWRQGQVIPGYLSPAPAATHSRPLDVAVVFPGYSAESLRLAGTAGSSGAAASLTVNENLPYASASR